MRPTSDSFRRREAGTSHEGGGGQGVGVEPGREGGKEWPKPRTDYKIIEPHAGHSLGTLWALRVVANRLLWPHSWEA